MSRDLTLQNATQYVPNAEFNQAVLHFSDGSFVQFEHIGRDRRWARASAEQTIADQIVRAMRLFRLNAKHLQLFFEDGTDAEFVIKHHH